MCATPIKLRILIAEAEINIARDLRQQLINLGYELVAEAREGEEAILLCGQLQPDLVLMAIPLAGNMDGIAAALTIRERFFIPIVLLTAFTDRATANRLMLIESPLAHINKPFSEWELHSIIELARLQHKTERENQALKSLYQTIIRTTMDGFWLADMQGRLLEVNEAYCQMSGYDATELLAMRISDLESVGTVADTTVQIRKITALGEDRFEARHRRKDGSFFDVEVHVQYQPAEGGLMVAFLRDITARKCMENILNAQLRLSEFSTGHSLEQLLQETLDEAEKLTASVIGFFHFVETDQKTLWLQTWSTHTLAKMCTAEGKGRHYNVDQAGVWVDCLRERRPVIHNDYAALAHRKGLPSGHAPIHRELVVPVIRDGLVMAILGVGNKPQNYDEQDIKLMTSLANLCWDIVRLKQTEEALRAQEHKAARIFQATPLGIATSINRVLESVNETFCGITGYSRDEVIGQNTRMLYFTDAEHQRVGQEAHAAIGEKGRGTLAACWRRKDGTAIKVELTSTELTSDQPAAELVFAVQDCTARHQMESELREKVWLLRKAQEIARFGTCKFNLVSGIWESSPHLDVIFGIDGRYLRDLNGWLGLVASEQRREMSDYLSHDILIERRRFAKEYRIIRHSDGQGRWVSGIGELELDSSGHPVLMMGTIQDITERKVMESEHQEHQQFERIGRLAGGVAHEFNNILTAMMLDLGLLQSKALPPEVHASCRVLRPLITRAAKLTQQLLMFAGNQMLQITCMELNGALASLLDKQRLRFGASMTIKYLSETPSLWVDVDAAMLEQVVMSLCINAQEAMPDGGTLMVVTRRVEFDPETALTVAGARPGSFACLVVSDTGHGIPPDALTHVFEPFYTTKDVGNGTGLSLASVQGIIQQHKGWINVESILEEGTEFQIYLPCSTSITPSEHHVPLGATHQGGRETILLVENELVVRKVAAAMLLRLGYQVFAVADGHEALRLLEAQVEKIDLLLTDLALPGGMTGIQLGKKLREKQPALKIVFMSGRDEELTKIKLQNSVDVAVLCKPFELRMLAVTIRQCLDGDFASRV